MAKYSFEFKKKIVLDYLSGKGGYRYLATQNSIPDHKIILNWIHAYKMLGDNGLFRSRKQHQYSFEFKLNLIESYLTSELSYQDLGLSVGIGNPSLIVRWVNDFRVAGPDALKPKHKGRRPKVTKAKIPSPTEAKTSSPDNNAEYLKQLEEDNLKLRIENAYLKELRRLRLEEKALLKKRRESSAVSEEHSD